MSYEVITTTQFEREAKHLIKKYASLTNELSQLIDSLVEQPVQGTSLANNYVLLLKAREKERAAEPE
jgi:mRNA-degrading endonuclease YafQ of YafQ-DinJ toxin-antitoxin module